MFDIFYFFWLLDIQNLFWKKRKLFWSLPRMMRNHIIDFLQQSKDLNDSLLAWIHIFLDRLHNRLTLYNEKVIPDYIKQNRIEMGVFSWPVVVRSNQFPNNMVKEINEFDNCTFFQEIVLYEEGTLPNKLLLNCFSIKNFANGL